MDTINNLKKLAVKGREQELPVFFVSDRVIQRIHSKPAATANFFAFDIFAIASAVAASILLFIGIQSWLYITNPLTRLFAPLSGINIW
jgi:hypothetical protein